MNTTKNLRQAQVLIVAVVTTICLCGISALAQDNSNAIWNGVYTTDQAVRGKANFLISCDRCHAQDLSGLTAPALKGDSFMLNWGGGSLNRLFTKIRDTMPPTFGSPLTDEAKLEVVAYILETNGFPSGDDELLLEAALLDNIQIVGESGDLPNFALVQVVGCLTPGPDDTWRLTDTSAPAITGEDVAGSEALAVAAMKELGDGAFRLVSTNSFEPTAHDGHKMEARGLLYIDESDALLNVTSLQMVASSCGE